MFSGHYQEAEQELNKVLDMDPNFSLAHYALAETMVREKKFDQAVSEMEKTLHSYPGSSYYRGYLGYALAAAGRNEDARKILGALIEEAKTKYVSWLGIAYIYAGLSEKDHSFAALELAYQKGDPRMDTLRTRADMIPSWKTDPRFAGFLKKVGLPPLNQ